VLRQEAGWQLYCCHTLRTRDMAGNPHVLSVGVDLGPALASNTSDAGAVAKAIGEACLRHGGEARIEGDAGEALRAVANILGIGWIEESLAQPARIICPRSSRCTRGGCSPGARRGRDITEVQREILVGGDVRAATAGKSRR
jgi:hypothetical protein